MMMEAAGIEPAQDFNQSNSARGDTVRGDQNKSDSERMIPTRPTISRIEPTLWISTPEPFVSTIRGGRGTDLGTASAVPGGTARTQTIGEAVEGVTRCTTASALRLASADLCGDAKITSPAPIVAIIVSAAIAR